MMQLLIRLPICCVLLWKTVGAQVKIMDVTPPRNGDRVNLNCTISKFTSPATWDFAGVTVSTCFNSGTCSPPSDGVRYSFSATSSFIVVTILSFNSTIDTSAWKCSHVGIFAEYLIKVAIPVTSVKLENSSGYILNSAINIVRGKSMDFRCSTSPSGSRPRATFQWYKKEGNQLPSMITDQSISIAPEPQPVPGQPDVDLLISYSTLTLQGDTVYQNLYIFCEGRDETNRSNYIQSGEIQLNIVYGPGNSTKINPNYYVYEVEEGRTAQAIICSAVCNPSCSYKWLRNNIQISSQGNLSLGVVHRNMSGRYDCEALNTVLGINMSSTIALEVKVQYAPIVKLEAEVQDTDPYIVKAGHKNVTLMCEVQAAYPQPTLFVWTHARSVVQNGSERNFIISEATREIDGIWGCKGVNNYGTPLEDLLVIDVQYGPLIDPIEDKTVIESQSYSVMCKVDANPQPISVSWTKDNNATFFERTAVLTLKSVSRHDSGTYRCTAVNQIHPSGQNEETLNGMEWFYLNVQYGAEIENISVVEGSNRTENSTATLSCHIKSNPESNITWTTEETEATLQADISVRQSQVIFEHVQCLDTGNYTCRANNGLGTLAEAEIPLYVMCHPRTDFRFPQETKIYQKLHTAAILRYTVISYPLPTFTWTFIGNSSESRDLPASVIQYDDGHQTELRFTRLGIDDFGYYSVTANNSLYPSAKEVFEIIPADVPEVPSKVTVIDLTLNSVTIQWVAGYNGGLQQTFHIIASIGEFTRSVTVPDPGYGKKGTAVLESLLPGTRYSIYMTAINAVGSSNKTETITIVTLEEVSTRESLGIPVAGIAGGIVAGFVVILCVVIGIFLWRKYQHAKQNEHVTDNDIKREHEERSQINANSVQQDAASGKVYEGLHFKEPEASQYLELNDIALEEKRNANLRPPENDSYEKLHPYTNNDIQMYSSLKIPKTSKDSDEKYENTWIK